MYKISTVAPSDAQGRARVRALLEKEQIRMDANLDYTCAIFDETQHAIATGSCYGNTLRCFAVAHAHQGEGILHALLTHLMDVQKERGNDAVFLYTKGATAPYFQHLGFHEIARVGTEIVFLENKSDGFSSYLENLSKESPETSGTTGAIVLNANPFTRGHLYLVEYAARECDLLHLFIVSEEMSLFPFAVRERLVRAGTAHLNNVICHASGPYIVSQSTFPSYFQKDEDAVIESHAKLDIAVFTRIAAALGITRRYVGSEHASRVTRLYNEIMQTELPKADIECRIIPRREISGAPISASNVRRAIKDGDLAAIAQLVPETTLAYLKSPESAEVRAKIAAAENVVHY